MSFDLQEILKGKRALRRELAARPLAESAFDWMAR